MEDINNLGIITELQVVEHGRLRKVTQGGAVINTIELSRVKSMSVVLLNNALLVI